jgi:DNA invertase Pin-like site-specific DNA recombinase
MKQHPVFGIGAGVEDPAHFSTGQQLRGALGSFGYDELHLELGRSLQHLVGFLDEIRTKGVHLYIHQQGVDTTTPAGKALFQMTGVFAEFERAMMQERVKAGLERARAQGKTLGHPKVPPKVERAILKARKNGTGMIAIAKRAGCGVGTVQRVLSESREASEAHIRG